MLVIKNLKKYTIKFKDIKGDHKRNCMMVNRKYIYVLNKWTVNDINIYYVGYHISFTIYEDIEGNISEYEIKYTYATIALRICMDRHGNTKKITIERTLPYNLKLDIIKQINAL